jgi:hypothetical protein
MLAIALSTEQQGDQLFLQVIGEPGSGKTRFCDAMLTSKHCHALEHLTGFHSGMKDSTGDDFSLIARIDRKTLITPEGDVLMSSPKFDEIMSQQRRIFDGTTGATYKNRKEDMRYTGLRTPWIIAGTPSLMGKDQSRLGDRFLRITVEQPAREERYQILLHAGHSMLESVKAKSNCTPEGQLSPAMHKAYSITGGYVDFLRADPSGLLKGVEADPAMLVDTCTRYGEFVACMRAKPDEKDTAQFAELPTRLTQQFVRLAVCIAGVMNKTFVDDEVYAILRKVALDTSFGRTLDITRILSPQGDDGIFASKLAILLGISETKTEKHLDYLRSIGVCQQQEGDGTFRPKWCLTSFLRSLYEEMENDNH